MVYNHYHQIVCFIILFTDASKINLKYLIREQRLPLRLLLVGLPLTMLLGTAVAWPFFPGVSLWLLASVAFMLSPTDAALGQAVVENESVPSRLRTTILTESGINDGFVLPPLLLCIAMLSSNGDSHGVLYWMDFMFVQIAGGALLGALAGVIGGKLISLATDHKWMNGTFQRLSAVSLSLIAYGLAESFHGNGLIGAFFAGLFLNARSGELRERIQEFGEAEGQQRSLFIFLFFGMFLVPIAIPYWNLEIWVYALCSLTVLRMIPVYLSLLGTELRHREKLFVGWFGPRGIASILYIFMFINKAGLEGYEQALSIVVLTVLISVFAHGLSSVPLANRFRADPEVSG